MTAAPSAPPDFDVLDPRFHDDPWAVYRWLRRHAPVFWDERNELWLVSGHVEVSHVSRNPQVYSSARGVRPGMDVPMSIIGMDDPEHTRQRRLINRGFTPRRVREITGHMRELTSGLIDDIASRGEIDFVGDFAIHLPLIIIAELIGLDPTQRDRLYRWSDAMVGGDGRSDPDDPALVAAATAFGEYAAMCSELIDARRGHPVADDLISILSNAYDEGALANDGTDGGFLSDASEETDIEGTLTNDELFMFLCLLVVAGNETTRNALTGALLAFSRFPDQRRALADRPELIDSAVDEVIRYVSPVISFMRTVTTTHEYEGLTLEEGQQVLLLYQSANRDETVFDAPDEFRIDRSPNPHVGFGVGTHYCLGASLARAELDVALTELLRRLPDIRVPEGAEVRRGDSTLVIALQYVPAVFTPTE
ncbi:MAG TPA: cytochrome P450 [Acidimicrobiales bacterium]